MIIKINKLSSKQLAIVVYVLFYLQIRHHLTTNQKRMKLFGKQFIFSLAFLITSSLVIAQNNIDFAQYNSLNKAKEFFNSKTNKSDFAYGNYKTYEKGLWNDIPIEEIVLRENHLTFSASKSIKNSTKRIIEYLEKNYPIDLTVDKEWSSTTYSTNAENFSLKLVVDINEDKKVGENTKSDVTITYKEVINNALAKISTQLKSNSNGIDYYVDLKYFQVSPKILINGIPIYTEHGKSRHINENTIHLNPYILNSKTPITLQFIIDPGLDENQIQFKSIPKESYFRAALITQNVKGDELKTEKIFNNQEYVTDTITENGKTHYYSYPGTSKYGKKNIEFAYTFNPEVNYDVKGWSNGKDLRTEKDLEQKIKTFYHDFGDLIIAKNIDKISDLLYDNYFEYYTFTYNIGKNKSFDDYKKWVNTVESSFKTIFANETKLHISTDGKLAYLEAIDKSSYLKAVGKNYSDNIEFIFYMDKTTNQLKIIR